MKIENYDNEINMAWKRSKKRRAQDKIAGRKQSDVFKLMGSPAPFFRRQERSDDG